MKNEIYEREKQKKTYKKNKNLNEVSRELKSFIIREIRYNVYRKRRLYQEHIFKEKRKKAQINLNNDFVLV